MERTHSHEHEPQQPAEPARITPELLDKLPAPQEAAGVITMALSDMTREEYFNALSQSRDISAETARAIAYNLIAHAPDGAATDHLQQFFVTGTGSHDDLLAEYLPLYHDLRMPAEGRLLLDALGTHLFHQEYPDTVTRGGHLPYALDGGLFYTDNSQGERVAVAFQLPMGLAPHDASPLTDHLKRHVRREDDAFRAFLRLPGIDAMRLDLIPYYRAVHLKTPEEVEAARERTHMRPTPGATPDWETVEIGGQLHVFSR